MRSLALCLPLALLAACGDDAAEDGDGRSASGEVLDGTISDEMLPLDQVQSTPPLLQPERAPRAEAETGEAGEPDEAAGEEATSDEAVPEEVEVLAPEPASEADEEAE